MVDAANFLRRIACLVGVTLRGRRVRRRLRCGLGIAGSQCVRCRHALDHADEDDVVGGVDPEPGASGAAKLEARMRRAKSCRARTRRILYRITSRRFAQALQR